MSTLSDDILGRIPQRPPFLFVDKILSHEGNRILAQKELTGEEDFFKGHFPEMPIMPGVLLCEAVFQTGALLVGLQGERPSVGPSSGPSLGVVTRIESTKFKNFVRPGDTLIIEVELQEQIQNAYYMKGSVSVSGAKVMTTSFTCALVNSPVNSPKEPQKELGQ